MFLFDIPVPWPWAVVPKLVVSFKFKICTRPSLRVIVNGKDIILWNKNRIYLKGKSCKS